MKYMGIHAEYSGNSKYFLVMTYWKFRLLNMSCYREMFWAVTPHFTHFAGCSPGRRIHFAVGRIVHVKEYSL